MRYLTYTNVTATLALFVALGGTSYAAATLTGADVRNGTVTGSDLRSESVKGLDVDNDSLTGSDFRNGSLTTSDLDSLAGADFRPGQLAAGPAGPQGPAGTTQAPTRRAANLTIHPGSIEQVIASCLPGETAVGGGADYEGDPEFVAVVASHPLEADGSTPEDGDRPAKWVVTVRSHFFTLGDRLLTTYVLCANA